MSNAVQATQGGGLLGGFRISSGAVIYPMLAKLIQTLAHFETYFTKIMNETVQGQLLSSKAAAEATKSAMDHQAAGLEDQAWAGIAGSAGSLAMTGLTFGVDTLNQSRIEGNTEELNNAREFKAAYDTRARNISLSDTNTPSKPQIESPNETLSEHVEKTRDVVKRAPNDKDKQVIETSSEPEAQRGSEAMDKVIKELESEQRQKLNAADNAQNILRQLSGFVDQLPRSIGSFLQSNETSAQGVEEKIKILQQSNQSVNQSIEQQESKQFTDTSSTMTQLMDQFSQLARADSYQ